MANAAIGVERGIATEAASATQQPQLRRPQVAVVGGKVRYGGFAETQPGAYTLAQFLQAAVAGQVHGQVATIEQAHFLGIAGACTETGQPDRQLCLIGRAGLQFAMRAGRAGQAHAGNFGHGGR
ncbi:hypothetical protein G6F22_015336 [Rhizopus arrhizus]|nr:hypothetical protein G6F22_015336 [Rhizopus arrhizus]